MPIALAPDPLPDGHPVTYNGVTFPARTATTHFDARPVYDDADRAVKYVEYTIKIHTLFNIRKPDEGGYPTAGGPMRLLMAELLDKPTEPGGVFTYTHRGLELEVNVPGQSQGQRDAAWGPKPRLVALQAHGELAVELDWQVQVCVPACANARFTDVPLAVNYAVEVAIENGWTTRTVTGTLEIPMTRKAAGDRSLPDCADAYLERVAPAVPTGFRRGAFRRTVSEDKRKLTWSVTDAELAAPPQEDVVLSDVRHRIQSSGSLMQWAGTLSATYELTRGTPRAKAAERFFDLALDRLGHTDGHPAVGRVGADGRRAGVIPVGFSMEEDLFGREAGSFTLHYLFACELPRLLEASGFWRPAPGADFGKWRASMEAGKAFGPRGYAGWTLRAEDDALVDACGDGRPRLLTSSLRASPLPRELGEVLRAKFPEPRPEGSWVEYQCRLETHAESGRAVLTALPREEPRGERLRAAALGEMGKATKGSTVPRQTGVQAESGTGPGAGPGRVQQRAAPSCVAILAGYAVRYGYKIAEPILEEVGGGRAVKLGTSFTQWCAGVVLGRPVNVAAWRSEYEILGATAEDLEVPANPALGQAPQGPAQANPGSKNPLV